MPSLQHHIELPYRSEDIFDLISDINAYPDFIRWITAMKVYERHQDGENWHSIAQMTVGYKMLTERLVTEIHADKSKFCIDINLVRGPFRHLDAKWKIAPNAQGSHITFSVDYRFKNPMFQALLAANFNLVTRKVIECYIIEAKKRFGHTEDGLAIALS